MVRPTCPTVVIAAIAMIVISLASGCDKGTARPAPQAPRTSESTHTIASTASAFGVLPPRILSYTATFEGTIAEYAGDQSLAARTLVQLQYDAHVEDGRAVPAPDEHLISIMSTDGKFEFTDMPVGDYVVWVWWAPGFAEIPATAADPGLFLGEVTVARDGRVTARVPLYFRLNERPYLPGRPERAPGAPTIAAGVTALEGVTNVGKELGREPAFHRPVTPAAPIR